MKSPSSKTELTSTDPYRETRSAGSRIKRLLALNAVLGVVTWGTAGAHANLLFNGNLDEISISSQINASPTGWTIDASKTISGAFFDGADSETFCNVADTGGYGLFFKPFQGDLSAGDLLTVNFYQDNQATPNTKFTLSFYAAGEANYSGFFKTNNPAPKTLAVIEFLDSTGTAIVTNAFDLVAAGLPNGGPGSMASFLYTSPQVTAPAKTVTVRAGCSIVDVYGTTGAQSFFIDVLDLESTAPPGSPIITNQPVQSSIAPGSNATFTVSVSNPSGVTYQWQHYSTNLVDGGHVSGANQQTLTITGASSSDTGHYRALVSNSAGSVYSTDVTLTLVDINLYPVVLLSGKIGDTYRVDYATALAPTNWIPLSTNVLTTSPQLVVDTSSPRSNNRFYRAVFLH
jgi:hypothetical protein